MRHLFVFVSQVTTVKYPENHGVFSEVIINNSLVLIYLPNLVIFKLTTPAREMNPPRDRHCKYELPNPASPNTRT